MKCFVSYLIKSLLFIALLALITPACRRKSGCPTEDMHTKVDKKGNPKSKPKSGLWDKKHKMNKK
ncbi:MAG: hypothetical protein IPQ10_01515 [Saprospiraceae bacterium]|nr:hypothetical protein [Saprospiraceae bacterium]MBK7796869.1 hypothetical protein [Saprospiraceae bacterium]MBK8152367.1 hypothetical protein [Saprospiraceae bacterium]MBL0259745.1 hypothetical protein [Saprospiraceae bacterium]MBX7163703.1 hypothetical protein [Saprospiraceae bacterium]